MKYAKKGAKKKLIKVWKEMKSILGRMNEFHNKKHLVKFPWKYYFWVDKMSQISCEFCVMLFVEEYRDKKKNEEWKMLLEENERWHWIIYFLHHAIGLKNVEISIKTCHKNWISKCMKIIKRKIGSSWSFLTRKFN